MPAPVNQSPATAVDGPRPSLLAWLRHDASRLFWPPRCLVCAGRGEDRRDLCPACAGSLPWQPPACERCALPLPDPLPQPGARTCGPCLRRPPPLDAVRAACAYGFPVDWLLPRFKFRRDLAAGRLLAQLMVAAFVDLPRPAVLVPVPLHRARLRQRGYDQALELARPLARALQVPLRPELLVRVRATAPQSRLGATARRHNLDAAFVVRAPGPPPPHVMLVDDVMTTGATLHAAARALRRGGVGRVEAWVCARVA